MNNLDLVVWLRDFLFYSGGRIGYYRTDGILVMYIKRFDFILDIIYRFTKSTHYLQVYNSSILERLAQIYIQETVCLHWVPISFICDHLTWFISCFLKVGSKVFGYVSWGLAYVLTLILVVNLSWLLRFWRTYLSHMLSIFRSGGLVLRFGKVHV